MRKKRRFSKLKAKIKNKKSLHRHVKYSKALNKREKAKIHRIISHA